MKITRLITPFEVVEICQSGMTGEEEATDEMVKDEVTYLLCGDWIVASYPLPKTPPQIWPASGGISNQDEFKPDWDTLKEALFMNGNYSPEQERLWAEQRHASLVRTLTKSPAMANRVLAYNAQYWLSEAERDPTRVAYGLKIFEELAAWIAANATEGAAYLERWDRIQRHERKLRGSESTFDPLYSTPVRVRARDLWHQQQQQK